MKLLKHTLIFVIFIIIACGNEKKHNKAEQELKKIPNATLDEQTVRNSLIYVLMIAPTFLPHFEVYILPPWPMESEPEPDNCPVITDNSSGEDVYIVNEGNCTDKYGFVWSDGRAIWEGKYNRETGEFNLTTTYGNFGFASEGVRFTTNGTEHTEGKVNLEYPYTFNIKHDLNTTMKITYTSGDNKELKMEGYEEMQGDAKGFSFANWSVGYMDSQIGQSKILETVNGDVALVDPDTPDYKYDDIPTVNLKMGYGGEGVSDFEYFISGKVEIELKNVIFTDACKKSDTPASGAVNIHSEGDNALIIFDKNCDGCYEWYLDEELQEQLCGLEIFKEGLSPLVGTPYSPI